jgi:predicted aldo/keto reductase-like oxidoreductase
MDEKYHELALRYAWSLDGCATAVIGIISMEELDENVRRARAFMPLSDGERAAALEVGQQLASDWGAHLGPV